MIMIIIQFDIGRGQMNISMNAWLLGKIDDYKFSVRDATVDFYMAEASLGGLSATSTT